MLGMTFGGEETPTIFLVWGALALIVPTLAIVIIFLIIKKHRED